ncbi:Molybdenum cofactor sulfurase [Platanthera zijinensis]|uniref:Molybdenum cofactor sulfurase n=1 Tax=Platanthera zijinensis TaxID=2320716 RepID=A0AAP0AXQ3_9ASPA
MHLSPWTHVSDCTSMIFNRKSRHRDTVFSDDSHEDQGPSNHGPLRTSNLRDALKEAPFHSIESAHSIPELSECFDEFITMYPAYQSSNQLDQLRSDEYFHLAEPEAKVCLDYCGFGLFSFLQTSHLPKTSAFSLSKISANLRSHALYGGARKNTAEDDMKATIMDYLNTSENEYSFVFTVSRGSAFQLLADSYPFQNNKKLLTMFDHESQSVALMAQKAREKGAEVYNAKFKWPLLKVCRAELIKMLSRKKRSRADSVAGLFIFPVQSRVSGEKYDYRWMALAKQYNWHVLLDAGSLGPKDMESFGLSLFRPDFIITSFYRVFGSDPTGFGCLLIKNSVLDCLQNQSGGGGGAGSGMVRIVHDSTSYLSDSVDGEDGFNWAEEDGISSNKKAMVPDSSRGSKIPAFSGAYTAAQVKHVIEKEIDSTGEIMKSPIFSEDGSFESSCLISLGQSPFGSENSGQINRGKMGTPSSSTSFSEGKNGKRLPPKADISDEHVLSESIDLNTVKKDPKVEHFTSVTQKEIDGADSINGGLIRRETEFEFMVLGRREGNTKGLDINIDKSASFSFDDGTRPSKQLSHYLDSWEAAASQNPADGWQDEEDYDDEDQQLIQREPEIVCRHIDHINTVGSDKISLRLRYLVNWLITSLLQLRFAGSESEAKGVLLVSIYGPKVKYERGAAVAFNVRGKGGGLIHPETVQKLAEKNGINLGVGFLRNIRFVGKEKTVERNDCSSICELSSRHGDGGREAVVGMEDDSSVSPSAIASFLLSEL